MPLIAIDQAAAEDRLAAELTAPGDPVQEFNRRWALTLLDTVNDPALVEGEIAELFAAVSVPRHGGGGRSPAVPECSRRYPDAAMRWRSARVSA